jgi:hypothetical protein
MEGFLKIKLIFMNGKLVCGLEGKFFEGNNVLILWILWCRQSDKNTNIYFSLIAQLGVACCSN